MTDREMARLLGRLTVQVPFLAAVLVILLGFQAAGVIDEASVILIFMLVVVLS